MTAPPTPSPPEDLDDLFENAPCGYVLADRDGRITRANATLAGWLGVASADLNGKRLPELLTVGGKIYYETHFAPLVRMQGAFDEAALDLACADGRKLPTLVNAVERRDSEGHTLSIRLTFFKATARRRYERDLLAARSAAETAMAAERVTAELREQFIAVLGHDLRNPLASIAGGVRLLRKETLSERGLKVLTLMEGSVMRASGLIDNVLDFARARLGGGLGLDAQPHAPVAAVLDQVVAELRSVAGDRVIDAHIDIAGPVTADAGRIGQLASNLLGNALTHGADDRPVELRATDRDGVLEISVANGGEPIAEETLTHLFQPFFRGAVRASQQGLGLGLYIAAEIARAHGGRLEVTSDPNETRFTFHMSAAPPDAPAP